MDPYTLANRVAAQERLAQEQRERQAQAADAYARRARRYVTLDQFRGMARLTIRGHAWRLTVGLALLAGSLLLLPLALGGNESMWLAIVVCALVGLVLIVRPRSTVHLLATPQYFAVYGRNPDLPSYTGERDGLSASPYHRLGSSGIHVRVWYLHHYWEQTYTGIRHPDDFAALAAWKGWTRG